MWYLILITTLLFLIYFKKKSKSKFFEKDEYDLELYRETVYSLLRFKGRNIIERNQYLAAYDFFCKFTTKFDGATFVKDLHDLPGLDLDAMLHDYECLIGANRNYKLWYIAVWNYYENMRKNGKGNQIIRALGLCVIGLFFVPYCIVLTPKYEPIKNFKGKLN